jgi:hypothetical protein
MYFLSNANLQSATDIDLQSEKKIIKNLVERLFTTSA